MGLTLCVLLLSLGAACQALTSYSFALSQAQCGQLLFPESSQQVGPLAPTLAGSVACPSARVGNVTFTYASAGIVGEAASNWTMSNVVASGAFASDVFTMAVWFKVAAPSSPTLVRFGQAGQFVLTASGFSMDVKVGNGLVSMGSAGPAGFPLATPGQTYAMVITAGVASVQLFRTAIGNATWTMNVPTLEANLNATTVVFARATAWQNAPLILGALGDGSTTVLGFTMLDANVASAVMLSQWKPSQATCPSVASFYVNATENKDFDIDFSAFVYDAATPAFDILGLGSLPAGGTLRQSTSALSMTYEFNPNMTLHPRVDSFSFYAVNAWCQSVVAATVTIYVTPVNHPPTPVQSPVVNVTQGAMAPLAFRGNDPDGANDVAAFVVFAQSALLGSVMYCANATLPPATVTLSVDARSSGGDGVLCYVGNFSSPALNRTGGAAVVGVDLITYTVVDAQGAQSINKGAVVVELANPASAAVALTVVEQIPALLFTHANVSRAAVVSSPAHGAVTLVAAADNVALPLGVWTDASAVAYVSTGYFHGRDTFQVQVLSLAGFVSPPVDVEVTVNYTYHPTQIVLLAASLSAQFAYATPLNLSLINVDSDAYSSSVVVILASTAGVVRLPSIAAGLTVVQGSDCAEVGCAVPIEVQGPPSLLASCLALAEYMAVAPIDNSLDISVTDGARPLQVASNATLNLIVSGGVWGTGDPAMRGDAAIGAALVGAVVAALVAVGGCAWMLAPCKCAPQCARAVRAVVETHIARVKRAAATRWSSSSSSSLSSNKPKTVLRPPPAKVRATILEGNPDALMDGYVKPPPGLTMDVV